MQRDELVRALAHVSDRALDEAYGYGLATPGSFGEATNIVGAEAVLTLLEQGEIDIEKLAKANHEGWAKVALEFEDPQYEQKPQKREQRHALARTSYHDLPDEEQEKDRVAARALLRMYQEATQSQQAMGQLE